MAYGYSPYRGNSTGDLIDNATDQIIGCTIEERDRLKKERDFLEECLESSEKERKDYEQKLIGLGVVKPKPTVDSLQNELVQSRAETQEVKQLLLQLLNQTKTGAVTSVQQNADARRHDEQGRSNGKNETRGSGGATEMGGKPER